MPSKWEWRSLAQMEPIHSCKGILTWNNIHCLWVPHQVHSSASAHRSTNDPTKKHEQRSEGILRRGVQWFLRNLELIQIVLLSTQIQCSIGSRSTRYRDMRSELPSIFRCSKSSIFCRFIWRDKSGKTEQSTIFNSHYFRTISLCGLHAKSEHQSLRSRAFCWLWGAVMSPLASATIICNRYGKK